MAGLNKKDLQEAKKLVDQINKAYKELGKGVKFPMPDTTSTLQDFKAIADELRAIKADQKDAAAAAEKSAKAAEAQEKAIDAAADATRDLTAETEELFGAISASVDEMTNYKLGAKLANKSATNLMGISKSMVDIQTDLVEASTEDIAKLLQKAKIERGNLAQSKKLLEQKKEQIGLSEKEQIILDNVGQGILNADGLLDRLVGTQTKMLEASEAVDEQMGKVGVAAESISGGLKAIGMGSLGKAMGLDDALSSTRKLAKEAAASGKPFNASANLTKEIGANLSKAFGPLAIGLAILNQLVKAFKAIDGAAGEIAKSQGISAAEGRKQVVYANEVAGASGDALISTNDIVKSQGTLNGLLGTSVQFPAEMSIQFAQISEKIGLSAESMSFFAKNAIKGKGSMMEQLDAVANITTELNAQNKLGISVKSIQEGIGKLSASQRLNAKGSAEELAKQVYQAKLLGLATEDLNGVQNSLLDFESSIAAEMEAELMTGKQLNLEGARAAALAGDQAALATELRKEVGTIGEFEDMNVMKREAMAKAFGMNVDQMADMLNKQAAMEEMQKKTGGLYSTQSDAQAAFNKLIDEGMSNEQAAAKMKEDGIDNALTAQLESANQSDKINALTEKLGDIFIKIMGPIAGALDPFLNGLMEVIALVAGPLATTFKVLGAIIKPIFDVIMGIKDIIVALFDPTKSLQETFAEMGPVTSGMAVAFGIIGAAILGSMVPGLIASAASAIGLAISMAATAVASIASASAMTLGIGIVAIVAGIAVAVMAMKSATKDVGDMMIPSEGQTTVSSKEGGIFNLSPNDDLVAAPGAIDMMNNTSATAETGNMPTSPFAKIGSALGGLFGGGDNASEGAGGGSDMTETNKLLKSLISVVSEGGDVFLDGNKVGKSLVLANSEMG